LPEASERKIVQARILAYAQQIGWTYVSRAEAEARRGFDPDGATPEDRARTASLCFGYLQRGTNGVRFWTYDPSGETKHFNRETFPLLPSTVAFHQYGYIGRSP
jgi:hypothetical protein